MCVDVFMAVVRVCELFYTRPRYVSSVLTEHAIMTFAHNTHLTGLHQHTTVTIDMPHSVCCMSFNRPFCLPTPYLPACLSACQPTYQPTNLQTYQPTNLLTYQPTNLPPYPHTCLPTYMYNCLCTCLFICLPTCLPAYLYTCMPASLSACMPVPCR